ncbi:Uncharacterised protein [[Clostridium] sordellii]|uniref:hypothetical protein n=1 Tax=Paraclostridium sordellii TaxID=1505 RepID=UPI0005E98F5A|nr:hypothetical protein [Paeniclostridium sordellii]CEP41597.1 Uncharacterised protein [[Clostridium] sordellii] [Paeniclostridium sordellii]
MCRVIFNLFDPESIVVSMSRFFNLEERDVREYLHNIDFDNCDLNNECTNFISRFNLEMINFNYNNAYLKVKHATATIDNLDSIREHGLKELGYMLTENTPMRRFLASYNIEVDVENRKIIVDDETFDIFGSEENYENVPPEYNLNMHNIYNKLYIDNGEIEAFSKVNIDGIKRYSTIHHYPEILYNIDRFLSHINKDRYLGNSWLNTYNSQCYILNFEIPITHINTEGKDLIYKLLEDCFKSLAGLSEIYVVINAGTEIPFETISETPLTN